MDAELLVDRVTADHGLNVEGQAVIEAGGDGAYSFQGHFEAFIERGRIEVDEDVLEIGAAGIGVSRPDGGDGEVHDVRGVSVRSHEPGRGAYMFVDATAPSSRVVGGAASGSVMAATSAQATSKDFIEPSAGPVPDPDQDAREPWQVDVAARQQVLLGGDHEIVVTAPFRLTFWEIDATVMEQDGTWTIDTGDTTSAGATPATERHERRQAFVFVEQGRLEMSMAAGDETSILFDASVILANGASLENATGTLHAVDGARTITAQDLAMSGDLRLAPGPADGDRLPLRVHGADGARVGDEQLVLTAATTGSEPAWAWGLAAIAVLPLAAFGLRRPLHKVYARLDRALEEGDHRRVVAAPRRLVRSDRYRVDVAFMRAVSLLELDRPAAAARALDSIPRKGPHAAGRAILEAHVLYRQGDKAGAMEVLRSAHDPLIAEAAVRDPIIAALTARPPPEGGAYA